MKKFFLTPAADRPDNSRLRTAQPFLAQHGGSSCVARAGKATSAHRVGVMITEHTNMDQAPKVSTSDASDHSGRDSSHKPEIRRGSGINPYLTMWSGGLCNIAPDSCWIDDLTGEHVNAFTSVRTTNHGY